MLKREKGRATISRSVRLESEADPAYYDDRVTLGKD